MWRKTIFQLIQNKYVNPAVRPFVQKTVQQVYSTLSHTLERQDKRTGIMKEYLGHTLQYRHVNGNKDKKSKADYDYSVRNADDFAKLFLDSVQFKKLEDVADVGSFLNIIRYCKHANFDAELKDLALDVATCRNQFVHENISQESLEQAGTACTLLLEKVYKLNGQGYMLEKDKEGLKHLVALGKNCNAYCILFFYISY